MSEMRKQEKFGCIYLRVFISDIYKCIKICIDLLMEKSQINRVRFETRTVTIIR